MKRVNEHSAGGIVFRSREKGRAIEWLVCKHSGYHKWVLPKGIIETGETPEDAAIREVNEETGVKAKIIHRITSNVAYKFIKNGVLIDKKVDFFLMESAKAKERASQRSQTDKKFIADRHFTDNERQKGCSQSSSPPRQ